MVETMDQELERIKQEIRDLRKQRLGIAKAVYDQWVTDAQARIRLVAAKYGISLDNLTPVVTVITQQPPSTPPPEQETPPIPINFPQVGDVVKVPATIEETAGAASCSGQRSTGARWTSCQVYDVNKDGKIDITDTATIAKGVSATVTARVLVTLTIGKQWQLQVLDAFGTTRTVSQGQLL
jgi:hypothetical protein